MLTNSVSELVFESAKMQTAVATYVEVLKGDEGGGDGVWSGSNSGGNSGGNTPIYAPPITGTPPPEPTPTPTPAPPNTPVGPGITDIDLTPLYSSSLGDINGITTTLLDMANDKKKPLDELLLDKEMADEIKKVLLASKFLPEDLAKVLTDADSEVVRELINNIMNGKEPKVFELNTLNLGIVYTHLSSFAKKNGITVSELLNNVEYKHLLKEALESYREVALLFEKWDALKPNEFQAKLLGIFDGNFEDKIKDESVFVIRSFTDFISDVTKVTSEELLTDNKYASVIKDASVEFGKALSFLGTAGNYSDSGMKDVVSSLFNGKNAAAFGMDSKEVAGFKAEMDQLAKDYSVKVDTLFSNAEYSDAVKEALANSDNAMDVGIIFEKADPSVSQEVAQNLYNTKLA